MDKMDFEDILKAYEVQLSRIEDAKNQLQNLEEHLDKILKQIYQELLKTEDGSNGSIDSSVYLFSDLVHDWHNGFNYITVGDLIYQFIFVEKTFEVKDFKVIKTTQLGKKEVENAS
jgi:hypothetical protein